MRKFIANWHGRPYCLCHGKWELKVDGKKMTHLIPSNLRYAPMNTYGEYDRWYFGERYEEVWETYESGLRESEWINENHFWISKIAKSREEMRELFRAFQADDWRHGSCGGCI